MDDKEGAHGAGEELFQTNASVMEDLSSMATGVLGEAIAADKPLMEVRSVSVKQISSRSCNSCLFSPILA